MSHNDDAPTIGEIVGAVVVRQADELANDDERLRQKLIDAGRIKPMDLPAMDTRAMYVAKGYIQPATPHDRPHKRNRRPQTLQGGYEQMLQNR